MAEYRYNDLNQRLTTHFDTDADNDVDGSDTISHFAYDARWRTVDRYEDSDTDPTEQWVHHHAGLVESGSSSYIDDVILRDRDTTAPRNGTLDERVYYLQNWRADVVALITDTGDQIEQVRYEPCYWFRGLHQGWRNRPEANVRIFFALAIVVVRENRASNQPLRNPSRDSKPRRQSKSSVRPAKPALAIK